MSIFSRPIGGGLGLPVADYWAKNEGSQVNSSAGPSDMELINSDDLNHNSAFNESNFGEYLKNLYSGNLDYNRTLELLKFEQAFNREEAQKNRDFQALMSNSSFQRAVADLKSAGFNPALMVGLGGATTPTGSSAFSTSKNIVPSGNQMTSIINTLLTNAFKLVSHLIPTRSFVGKLS